MNDIELSELSNISYLDMKGQLKDMYDAGKLTMGKISDFYLSDEGKYFEKDNIQDQAIIAALKKYQNPPYSEYKVVDYENNNGTDGLVCIAVETIDGNIVVASRGSETPDENSGGLLGMEDWLDNLRSAIEIETLQQAQAKAFIDRVGAMESCKSISITGHSKGGNNALYALIMANPEVREKIINCVTFNAPGFNDDFIKENKDIIDMLVKAGIIKEYQGSGDLVSEIMNNLSNPIIIQQMDWKNKVLIDDHYIYAMMLNGDGTGFVIDPNGKKSLIPKIVNSIVNNLLGNLSDEEVDSVIELVSKIMDNKDYSIGNILDLLKESDVSDETIKVILLYVAASGVIEWAIDFDRKMNERVDNVLGLLKDVKGFVVNNLEKAKDYVASNLKNLEDSIVKFGKDSVRKIFGGPIDLSISNLVLHGKSTVIGNFIYSSFTDKKFIVNTDIIKSELRVYKVEMANLEKCISDMERTLKELINGGWSGQAAHDFLNIKFIMYKKAMDKCKNQLGYLIEYLNLADSLFSQRESEEKRLIRIL